MLTSTQIRQQFLDFFKSKGHTVVPSASIVLKDDPTLMFTNAGMNQFKDYFLGNKPAPYPRVVDTQKCLRVSGKQNDLEEVGVDTYHHTMFEMLGNWSFGDYFKHEALTWSWELLTEVYKIPKDRLYVSVFEGDDAEGIPASKIALDIWKGIVPEDRIIFGKKKDNFWEMGDTGPCGPCSEIHVDSRSDEERATTPGRDLVNADHPQVIEIWNNVFIQYNRTKNGSLENLPNKHVDTGMGFERLVRVIQGKKSNYDTDIFMPTINLIGSITGNTYTQGDDKMSIAFRVVADHIRAISFTIADGQLPSSNNAGYVIRRILRRAVRYYYSYLNYKKPLLHQLVATIAMQFEHVFPELKAQQDFVTKVIHEEEQNFLSTLETGLKRVDAIIANAVATTKIINGDDAFELNDTFGFPYDLTALIASENNVTIDEAGFNAAMQKQKERAKAAAVVDTEDWITVQETEGEGFVGYTNLSSNTQVQRYRKVSSKGASFYQLVLNTTPFYAESGGQVGDTGTLNFDGEIIAITNTKKENDLTIHFTNALPSKINVTAIAQVDAAKRHETEVHHSATHLMQAALRTVLGTHVAQKGSLNNDHHLRFDFSHFAKVTAEEVTKIEHLVNQKIRENHAVTIEETTKDEAVAKGAMALFGEKYGDTVRVVTMDPSFSIELCGGTHVRSTGQIGLFKIKHESAVAAGVRRLEAVCGQAADAMIDAQEQELQQIKEALKNPKEVVKAIEMLQAENHKMKKQLEGLEARQLVGIRNELLKKDEIINGITFVADIVEVTNADALKKLCNDLKNNLNDYVAVLCANIDGKPFVAIGIADTVVAAKNLDASALIKQHVALLIKGGGGGNKTLATAGGQLVENLQLVIDNIKAGLV
jgi:alanyl-tRNA synthetase